MKVCSRCKEEKSLTEFNKNKSKKDGLQYYCKVCQGLMTQEHYRKNKQSYVDNSLKQKQLLAEWFKGYKKTLKCSMCSVDKHYMLDFHHQDPEFKKFTVSQMIRSCGSKKRILEEIDKCIVVCKNCHSEIHYLDKTGSWGK